jgi:adenine-specific DNA-methyltransferase
VRTAAEVTPDKLRGGFYTPPSMVALALDRVRQFVGGRVGLRVLEPSAGDGAFLRGLAGHALADAVGSVQAVELLPGEAAALAEIAPPGTARTRVHRGDVLEWFAEEPGEFDVVVGNPPYVRYQFISASTRAAITRLDPGGERLSGVSNLWIPVLLAALDRLAAGGAFAFVLPTEFLTGVSGAVVRGWFARSCEELSVDLFPPHAFPGVLQQVAVVAGRRGGSRLARVEFTERDHAGTVRAWGHDTPEVSTNWTRLLLPPDHLAAVRQLERHPSFLRLDAVARFEVSIVTGANDYFTVPDEVLDRFALREWAVPLLPRIRLAEGLVFGHDDHAAIAAAGARASLLSFDEAAAEPSAAAPAAYLREGEQLGISQRYKCRIRSPWYRVPGVRAGTLLLSKRSHRFPRLVLNDAGTVTTDTIYRGRLLPGAPIAERDLVAGFHNSVTLLWAELEGRSFGGGVLELVPSEIARLLVPAATMGDELAALDRTARRSGPAATEPLELVTRTDQLLATMVPALDRDLLRAAGASHRLLMERRLGRASGGASGS